MDIAKSVSGGVIRSLFAILLATLCPAVAMAAAEPESAAPFDAPEVVQLDGVPVTITRRRVSVPENRSRPDSRQIEIAYYPIAALPDKPKGSAPIYMLAGGPGGSYAQEIIEDSPRAERLKLMVQAYRTVSDVVLVDLRGVFGSSPRIECDKSVKQPGGVGALNDISNIGRIAGERCRATLEASGFDIEGYTVNEAADDLIAVMDVLGHDKVILHGISFGSHHAMVATRRHPSRVAKLIVSGVEGFNDTLDDPKAVRSTLARIANEAAPVWQGRHGVSTPLSALDNLVRNRLDGDPASALMPYEIELLGTNGPGFDLSIRSGMSGWPKLVDALARGDDGLFRFLLRQRAGEIFPQTGTSAAAVGLFDCASWASKERLARFDALDRTQYYPDALTYLKGYCEGWEIRPMSASFYQSHPVKVPTLLVQGDFDVSTPFENAQGAATHFPNSVLVKIRRGSHRAMPEALLLNESFKGHLIDWIRTGKPPKDQYDLPPIEFAPIGATQAD